VVVAAGVTLCVPLGAVLLVQLPVAAQDVALVVDQASVEAEPALTVEGLAVSVTVGGTGCVTVTVAIAVAAPPAPEHVSV
jgi:hypothetical protein